MRSIFLALAAALLLPAFAQTPVPASADEAYDQLVVARRALQEAEMAQERGVEPLEGERVGTERGKSRLTEAYWQRQERLAQQAEKARQRVDAALERWHALR